MGVSVWLLYLGYSVLTFFQAICVMECVEIYSVDC